MAEQSPSGRFRQPLSRVIGSQEQRKLQARRASPAIWSGFGLFGLIGWSIAVPTLLGLLAGVWLDAHHPGRLSWTVAALLAGLCLGCATAGHWLHLEHERIRRQERDGHE